ncbi:uncharacterized protein N7458_011530 [Penicillium daleae]|uniref:Uncharacterized protein n=1 Tax=Penicillium daleae TaxID=63821 RepID=A0AAD6FX60_9EURO|nr:uncharacterized protein N7458_011530 [Penicillium daleae]KAJ5432374.1 hypothetical protein N7458_011530 [Penicillium daleae]
MSPRRPDNNPSPSHQAVPEGDNHNQWGSFGEQSSNQTAATRLAYYRTNTSSLLDFLKHSDQDSLDSFISVVRSGASHDDIFAVINQLASSTDMQRKEQNGGASS